MSIIKTKLDSMSNEQIKACHAALMNSMGSDFGPRGWQSWWDEKHEITMDDWAMAVDGEMSNRRLK